MAINTLKNIINDYSSKIKELFLSLKNNRDLLVFLVFLLLSTGLWFLNALRKDFVTTIEYPVKYSEFPEDFILLGEPQTQVQIKIRSLGYNLLPYHFGKVIAPEDLHVSAFKRMRKGNAEGAYVLTRDLKNVFTKNLTNGIDLLEIYPDTLFVLFEKKERKTVPVKFQSQLKFKPQYYQSGQIKIKPDSVEISGPSTIIDTVQYVYTENKVFEELSDSLIRNISLVAEDKLKVTPGRVVLTIPVEAYTEKVLTIPLKTINVPDSLRLKCFPSEIKVSFTVAVSKFNDVTSADFNALVDFNTNTSSTLPDRLKVKITDMPQGVKNVDYSPLFVDCLFEKSQSK
ncbi:YbbR-like domain-containing protein [Plebeiibacterium sediminum]|uniref:YbbR-like domain-containing protein n=1 Tax=Plebeiibacterium sediminum TaxID=2992112 RepID=A0AAE3M791_9BACT|nr:YbbR-like domain-containing protein [Plebeiobacterium sediminum]MCW3788094.1 YbbR-like domain-containing protein [Plebeiobacterium sediminum]